MRRREVSAFVILGALTALAAPAVGAGKSPAAAGHANLDGVWTNATVTTLERKPEYGERLTLSEKEVAAIELNRPLPETPRPDASLFAGFAEPIYNVMRVDGQPRTSFITTTPDGRIPPTRADRARAASTAARPAMGPNDNPEQRPLDERCLMSFGNSAGPVMLPLLYLNNYQFVETKDEVAILTEIMHDVRHIRLNAKSHLPPDVRPWMGDSIGHWEGATLVAETTNFNPHQNFRGSSANLKVTERFTRKGDGRMLYQFTVEDPTVWDKPWGGEYEFRATKGPIYEYACHEGNYTLEGILAGARDEEAAGPKKISNRPATR